MAEEKNPDVTITMRIDCPGLTNDKNGLNNVEPYVKFRDTLGDIEDTKGKASTFYTKVNSDAVIVWEGKSEDGIDSVHISNIYKNEGEADCFEMEPERLTDGSENWRAIAKNVDHIENGLACEYTIEFTINGDSKTVYILDPKLQIRRKEKQ